MAVVTAGCGLAADTIGSGVQVGDDQILTAGHSVAGSQAVWIVPADQLPADRAWPAFSPRALSEIGRPVTVTALDRARDLAVLATADPLDPIGSMDELRPDLVDLGPGSPVEIHGVMDPAPTEGVVAERTTIVADEVRGSGRVRRAGYRLAASTARGDSGAGVWSAGGQLAGMVFAVSRADDGRTWAVTGTEIAAFLLEFDDGLWPDRYYCDPERSRLESEDRLEDERGGLKDEGGADAVDDG